MGGVVKIKDVSLYVRGICKDGLKDKEGAYIVILNYKGVEKRISGVGYNTTSNRMIITGIIKSIRLLKESCNVIVHAPCPIGIKSFKKSINSDLLEVMFDEIDKGGHKVDFVVSSDRQNELVRLMREFNKKLILK